MSEPQAASALGLDRQALARALAALPDAVRRVAMLTCYEGLSTAEIANALTIDEAEVSDRLAAAAQALTDAAALPLPEREEPIQCTYLPFTQSALREHFAAAGGKSADTVAAEHLKIYASSAARYDQFLAQHPPPRELPVKDARGPCQIEKDELFWTASTLMRYYYAPDRAAKLAALCERAFGPTPPLEGIETWAAAFTNQVRLYFETNLPSPPSYRAWLKDNLTRRQFIPYVLRAAPGSGEVLEGPTHVDAIVLDPSTGCAILFEAKVLSDCSIDVTFDTLRNQISRNIDVMLDRNEHLPHPLSTRIPNRTLFVLLTPRLFRNQPHSRLYGHLMTEYRSHPEALARDLPHRADANWEVVSKRLGWLTWEDFEELVPGSCRWLGHPS